MDMQIFKDVRDFLERIPEDDSAMVYAHLKSLEEDRTGGLIIKALKGKIREMVVKYYRIIFFFVGST